MTPMSNTPLLVAVWDVLSLFTKVTDDPRVIVCGFGEYAVVVRPAAPTTIEIDGPFGDPDVGVVTVALSINRSA